MDIYLTENSSGQRLRIPLLPDRLSIRTGALTVAVNIIKTGEVKIPRGSTLTGYSWNGVFPSEALENASFVFDWQEPARIVAQIKEWEEKGSILRLMVTELSINDDVFIEAFNGDYYGIGDFSYTINLTARRELTVTTVPAPPVPVVPPEETPPTTTSKQYGKVKTNGSNLNIRKKASTSSTIIGKLKNGATVEILGKTGNWYIVPCEKGTNGKGYAYASYIKLISGGTGGSSGSSSSGSGSSSSGNKNSSSSGSSGSYTVKQGDTLYSIAKAMLGDGSRWMEIYNLNKTAIDRANAGKTVGKYTVVAGLSLKLPTKKTSTKTTSSSGTTLKSVVSKVTSKVQDTVKKVTTAINKVVTSKPVSTLINTVKTAVKKATATKTTTTSKKPTTVKKVSTTAKNLLKSIKK